MKRRANRNRVRPEPRAEALATLATGRTFSLVAGVLAFAVTFLGSQVRPSLDGAGSVGSLDPMDLALGVEASDIELVEDAPPPDEGLFYTVYQVVRGDTISAIAESYGVTMDSIVTFNGITNTRALSIGRYLKIPSMNGILHQAGAADSPQSLAASFGIDAARVAEFNGLDPERPETAIGVARPVFLPDARMSRVTLAEINGDLLSWPVRGWITSPYGWRKDPFSGARSFHTGIDIGSSIGVPVKAALDGRVSATGYSTVSGNYVVISHHSGYTTMYAHLSRIAVSVGTRVTQASVIGYVGNTGYSTGAHLHFTVNKWGRTINPMTVLP